MKLKILIVLILASLSFVIIGLGLVNIIRFDPENYLKLYDAIPSNCKINSKISIDQKNCYKSASIAFLKEKGSPETYDIYEYLCLNGSMQSCRMRDWFNFFFTSLLYTPAKTNIENLVSNCFNQTKLYNEKAYYCNRLYEIAKSLKDQSTMTSIDLMRLNFNFTNIHITPEQFLQMEFGLSSIYYELKCDKGLSNECISLSPWHELKNLIHESLINKAKFARLKKITNEICSTKGWQCNLLLENSNFLILAFIHQDIDFFIDLPLNFEASRFIMESIQQKDSKKVLDIKWLLKVKSNYLRFLLLNFSSQNDLILEECKQGQDKSGCFLSFKDNRSGRENLLKLKEFCSHGDFHSCSLVNIYEQNLDRYFSGGQPIYPTMIEQKEELIGWDITNSFTFKLGSFLSKHRNAIIITLIFLTLIFQFYIVHLYSKSSEVFKYIREKTLEEIYAKLKN